MVRKVVCSINITEADGKLAIFANIPDGAESTIAGALAQALMGQANTVMNDLLGQDRKIERITPQ